MSTTSATARPQVTLPDLAARRSAGRPIVMVTAYDYPSALAAERAGVDVVLVGDSGAMTVLGHPDTRSITVPEMLVLAGAVRRGLQTPLLVGDLPFGSYEGGDEQAIATAVRFVKEAGCDAVKLEGGGAMSLARARAVVAAGIPVMGHVGLTPQTAVALGGYRAQGRTAQAALRLVEQALALQEAGCFCLVLEAVPAEVATEVTARLSIPVIGIGAGAGVDGQVLVFHDLLGIREGHGAKFVRRYADLLDDMVSGVSSYAAEVRDGRYPTAEHGYRMPEQEYAEFRSALPAIGQV